MRISSIFTLLILLSGLSGCAHSGLYPVTVQIQDNGEPVDGVSITFVSDDGSDAYAIGFTDEQGVAKMFTFKQYDGVKPGTYHVRLSKYKAVPVSDTPIDPANDASVPPPPDPVPLIPRKFLNIETSGLTLVVEQKTPTLTFDLSK